MASRNAGIDGSYVPRTFVLTLSELLSDLSFEQGLHFATLSLICIHTTWKGVALREALTSTADSGLTLSPTKGWVPYHLLQRGFDWS